MDQLLDPSIKWRTKILKWRIIGFPHKLPAMTIFDLLLLFLCAIISPVHGFTNAMGMSDMDTSMVSSDSGSVRGSISKHAYGSRSSSGRRAPAVGLLAAGAVELQQVVDRVNYAAVGPAPERRNEKSVFPTLSASQAAAISSDEPGLLPFVAPTAVLTADPHKKNRTRYTPVSDTIRCYSCMSPFYESAWVQSLSRIYARPSNFSQQCDDSGSLRGITLVECPSICIKIREDIELSGIPFRGYIRGCYDTMLLHGFNQTLVRWFRWLQRDSCMDYNKYHILQLPPASARSQPTAAKPSTLHICTCYADTCNGSPRFSGASVTTRVTWLGRSLTLSLATTIGPLLVLICWWWRTMDCGSCFWDHFTSAKLPHKILAATDSAIIDGEVQDF